MPLLGSGRSFRLDVGPKIQRRNAKLLDVRFDAAIIQLRRELQVHRRRKPQELSEVGTGRLDILDGLDHLGLEVHNMESNADEVDLRDIALFEADRVDIEDAGKAVAILFGKRKTPLTELHAIVGVLDGKAELARRASSNAASADCAPKSRAFDPVAALSGQLEQLLNLRIQLPLLLNVSPCVLLPVAANLKTGFGKRRAVMCCALEWSIA